MDNWQDLTCLNPISGDIFNTDRQGWMPVGTDVSVWGQTHPALTAPADTTAPSVMVNYKQGEADFNDFTVWYHNSLGDAIRYGWTTKIRSHQKFLGVTAFDEQRHRAQVESELEDSRLRIELGYKHQINPLYMFDLDTTTQILKYDDDLQLNSERWDGNIHWQSNDSSSHRSEFFASVEGGLWDWETGEHQSLQYLAFLGRDFKLGDLPVVSFKLGGMSKQIGGDKSSRHFMDVMLPGLRWKNFEMEVGLRNVGLSHWLPMLDVKFMRAPIQLAYKTRNLVFDRVWHPLFDISNVHHIQAFYNQEWVEIELGSWLTSQKNETSSGYHARVQVRLPWHMQLMVEGQELNDSFSWVWSSRQLGWEINQDLVLFDKALFGHFKIWGRHLFDVNPGNLDPVSFAISEPASPAPSEDITHLLNYTISGQVSSLILAYTDSNILQDPIWSQNFNVPWDSEYFIMSNQAAETRFRYLSVIWVFDN